MLKTKKKTFLSMFTAHTRDLIHSTTKNSVLYNEEVDINYKVLGLKNDKELRFTAWK